MYKPEKRSYRSQELYDAMRTKRYSIKLNRGTDADIISYLDKQKSVQAAIKAAIRAAIEQDGQ